MPKSENEMPAVMRLKAELVYRAMHKVGPLSGKRRAQRKKQQIEILSLCLQEVFAKAWEGGVTHEREMRKVEAELDAFEEQHGGPDDV